MLINKNAVYWFFNTILLLALLFLITLPTWGHPPPHDPGYNWHHGSRHGHQNYYDYHRYRQPPPPPPRRWHPYYDHYRYRHSYPGWGCGWWSDGRGGCQFRW